mgnify:CR=1 FL=1
MVLVGDSSDTFSDTIPTSRPVPTAQRVMAMQKNTIGQVELEPSVLETLLETIE